MDKMELVSPSEKLATGTQEPSLTYSEKDLSILKKIFPPERRDSIYNIGITAIHGNEPHLIAASIAMRINDIFSANGMGRLPIVLPSLYGERTQRIMLEEFPQDREEIFISEDMGKILKQTEFSRAGYQAHLRSLAQNQLKTSEDLLNFLSRPFTAVSLSGKRREFLPQDRGIEINSGANVTASDKNERKTHFVFPVLLSELMESTAKDPLLKGHFNSKVLEQAKRIGEDIERGYLSTQVPYVSTLSSEPNYSTKNKILTPALKAPRVSPSVLIKEGKGIYVMASGNEIGKEVQEDQARLLSAQFDILSPAWLKLDFGQQVIPDVIFNPNVRVVIGRAGWGIMWMAQVAEKPFAAFPHLWFDNPEIHFNIKTIQDYGLGVEFNEEHVVQVIRTSQTASERIRTLNQTINRELKIPQGVDGVTFAAQNILKAEMEKAA